MKLVSAPDVAAWLQERPVTEWDAGNATKSESKYRFSAAALDSLLDGPVLFAGRIVEPVHDEARYLLLGTSADERHAALVFARWGDRLRSISCRAMRRKEKEIYDAAIEPKD